MYAPRTLCTEADWLDEHGVKIYTISADGGEVPWDGFQRRLAAVKAQRVVNWAGTPAFAIFHRGASRDYLVLAWWSNDNELFTSVSVAEDEGWVEDPSRYSFCLFDLEVFWAERNLLIRHLYSGHPNLAAYRHSRIGDKVS